MITIHLTNKIIKPGRPIQTNSESNTDNPYLEKKLEIPMGETSMGCQGKKYLEVSKGEKKAMPKPPEVSASSIPWETVHRKK